MRFNSTFCILLLLFFAGPWLPAQSLPDASAEKYWVFFTPKEPATLRPEQVLSERSCERREKQGIPIRQNDMPVDPARIDGVKSAVSRLGYPSKWLNAVSVWMTDAQKDQVAALPYVKSIQPIRRYLRDMDAPQEQANRNGYFDGYSRAQSEMIGLNELHQNGLNGRGVLISVMDNGFAKADENPHLQHLFADNRILATHDFVNGESDVFDGGSHGQWVLSILAGWHEDELSPASFYGSAHGATYILCHTENDASETSQEEDNWVRAMEWADSIGADVFSTSLSYRDFDGGFDYGYSGMDGNTAIITIAADIAASKGIVVVNSAGNSGNNKIYAPADGDSVIAVGAVDSLGQIAAFSSRGPTFDLRVKPDICAMGVSTAYIQNTGVFSRGNGTSFSCPVISGFLACLLQAKPEAGNMELYQAMIQSADRYNSPDTVYGYGIPNAGNAHLILTGRTLAPVEQAQSTDWETGMVAYPNPFSDILHVAIDNGAEAYPALIQLVDAKGRKIIEREQTVHPFYNLIEINPAEAGEILVSGSYTLRVLHAGSKAVLATQLIIYASNR